jgi:hypothetical protein
MPAASSAAFPTGQQVVVSAAFKPTSSLRLPARSLDLDGQPVEVVTHGRHDPCVGIRATPICEAMVALVLMDQACATAPSAATSATSRRASNPANRNADRVSAVRRSSLFRSTLTRHITHMTNKTFKVAIVGATGAVGETMLSILAEREFPVGELVALASAKSAGHESQIRPSRHRGAGPGDVRPGGRGHRAVLRGGSTSKEYAPKFAAAGAVVIDNSSAFRYDDDVPLVVSEVNPEQVGKPPARHHRQPELLDDADARRARADPPRRSASSASTWRPYQSVSGRRAFGAGGTRAARPRASSTSRTRSAALPGADRVQPDPAHRRLPAQRLHEGRDEAGVGDAEDPRRRQTSR